MTEREQLMNVRTFLRDFRSIAEPTTILSGTERVGVWIPESWQAGPRSAHPDPEAGLAAGDRVVSPAAPVDGGLIRRGEETQGADGSDGQTEAPLQGVAAPPAGRSPAGMSRRASARRPTTQAVLDRAAKEGRTRG